MIIRAHIVDHVDRAYLEVTLHRGYDPELLARRWTEERLPEEPERCFRRLLDEIYETYTLAHPDWVQ